MGDDLLRDAGAPCFAHIVELEKGGAGHELMATHRGEEGDVAFG
ncbi:MAG: hypothetical protein ACRD0S_04000 [Acidimicrobiales bacterium]